MGRFKNGTSGNPRGRPKLLQDVRDLARKYTQEAIETFVHIKPQRPRVSRQARRFWTAFGANRIRWLTATPAA
jgi:hypothetical protein